MSCLYRNIFSCFVGNEAMNDPRRERPPIGGEAEFLESKNMGPGDIMVSLNRKDLNYIFYALSCYAKDCPQLPEHRNNEDKMQKQNDVLNTRKKIKKSMAV